MKDDRLAIKFNTGVKYKGRYFLAAMHMNGLFLYDNTTDKLTFLTALSVDKNTDLLYTKAFLYHNEAWFIPANADHIAIVNLDTLYVEHLPLAYEKKNYKTMINYQNYIFIDSDIICLIPRDVDAAMVINLKSRETRVYYDISDGEHYYHCAFFKDKKLFLFPWTAKKVLVLDLETDERYFLPWDSKAEAFGEGIYEMKSGNLFFGPSSETFIKLMSLRDKCQDTAVIAISGKDYVKTFCSTENMEYVFFWGVGNNAVLRMSKIDNSVKKYQLDRVFLQDTYFPIYSDCVEALSESKCSIIRYDAEKESFTETGLHTDWITFFQEIHDAKLDISDVAGTVENKLTESEGMNLPFFVTYILRNKKDRLPEEQTEIGLKIFQHMLEKG